MVASGSKQRATWGSRLGFILAASGAAVGLGNIQRFPYIASENGGAAFLFVYLLCVLILGLPLLFVEFSIGRAARRNAVDAMKMLVPSKPWWQVVGFLGIATSFFVLCYYTVVAGWTLFYSYKALAQIEMTHEQFTSNGWLVISCTLMFQSINVFIVRRGLQGGIEACSKILLPLLLVLLFVLLGRALTLPNAMEGVAYYLYPDLSEVTSKTFLHGLSQAFFSLSLGEAVLLTYASYATKDENLIVSGVSIALFDTLVAFLAGLIVFPALFSFGKGESLGVGMVFQLMPQLFTEMPGGTIFGFLFFLLLAFAALTSCISLMEIPVNFLCEKFSLSREKSVWIVSASSFLIGIPVALSHGASHAFTDITIFGQKGVYNIFDFIWGSIAMVTVGFLWSIFVGWFWGKEKAAAELERGSPGFAKLKKIWGWHITYVAPLLIAVVFIGLLL